MTQGVSRLPFGLDPLIAEAKRRMRKRRTLAVVLVVVVAGAIGATLGLRPSHPLVVSRPFVATRPLERAFMRERLSDSWWSARTNTLHFSSLGRFAIGIVLRNEASQRVTLTGVSAVLPSTPLLRRIGTRLAPFTWPGHCPRDSPLCAGPSGVVDPRQRKPWWHGMLRPHPLQVAPGKQAGVQLDFQFGPCRARHASAQKVNRIDVTYRNRAGGIIRQRVALGPLALSFEPPSHCPG